MVSNPFPKLSFEGKFKFSESFPPNSFRGQPFKFFLEREQGAEFFKQTGKPAILKKCASHHKPKVLKFSRKEHKN